MPLARQGRRLRPGHATQIDTNVKRKHLTARGNQKKDLHGHLKAVSCCLVLGRIIMDKSTVAMDKEIIVMDKSTVARDRSTVAMDKSTVIMDKEIVAMDMFRIIMPSSAYCLK
jgi:hypothetical protein